MDNPLTSGGAWKTANFTLRFLLEIGALAALVYWGFRMGASPLLKILLGIGLPLIAAVAWGVFRVDGDPGKAPVRVPGWLRLLLELAFFGSATAALWSAGHTAVAYLFAALVLANYAALYQRLAWLLRQ